MVPFRTNGQNSREQCVQFLARKVFYELGIVTFNLAYTYCLELPHLLQNPSVTTNGDFQIVQKLVVRPSPNIIFMFLLVNSYHLVYHVPCYTSQFVQNPSVATNGDFQIA